MSEFDRLLQGFYDDETHDSTQSLVGVPADFSDEDVVFARELGTLFSAEQENMPPYFVQTLLDAENPRFQPATTGLEHRTSVRVFRRLKLRRRLFRSTPQESAVMPLQNSPSIFARFLPNRRLLISIVASCLFLMLASMIATGNSFAAGVQYIFAGQHSGVALFRSEPSAPAPQTSKGHQDDQSSTGLSLVQATRMLKFPMYWPTLPDNYAVSKLYLYEGSDKAWTDGPILMFVCNTLNTDAKGANDHSTSRLHRDGTSQDPDHQGQIVIWEFKPMGSNRVLQGIKLGAEQQVQIGPDKQTAIYVNGQWESINKTHRWAYNGSGELIYEQNDIVFWIQGTGQSIDQSLLVNVAQSLSPFDIAAYQRMTAHVNNVIRSSNDPTGTVSQIIDPQSSDGPAIVFFEAVSDQNSAPAKDSAMHLP
jgi:hypothetical protein